MPEITEFLLARIAEDEAAARTDLGDPSWGWTYDYDGGEVVRIFTPPRVAAECEAKRRIVEKFATWERENRAAWKDYSRWVAGKPTPSKPPARTTPEDMHGLEFAVREIASVYADHPDFDPAWRP